MVKKLRQHGFSTIEILIASSILVIVFSAVILLVLGGQKIAADTELAHEAQLLNQKLIEEARNASLLDFNDDVTVSRQQEGTTIYFKEVSQQYISECVKEITARVEWAIEGRDQYVTNTTQVTSPAVALAMGTECNTGTPPGTTFEDCTLYGSDSLEGPDQDAYDLAVTRIANQKHALIVTHPKSGQQAPEDLWIYNTDDESDPVLASKLNINNDDRKGINTVVVAKIGNSHYAFMGNDDSLNHLIVVDVSNPALPGAPILVNITGVGNDVVSDIGYFGNRLYVAIGNQVKIYNVSDPAIPALMNTWTFGGNVSKISFNANYLYAATADNMGELSRANLSTGVITKYNLNGNAANQAGSSIQVLGGRIYIGIQSGQNSDNFYIIDESGTGFTLVASHNLPHQNNKKILDHLVVDNFLFALVEAANKEFQVYDITNPLAFDDRCVSTNPTNVGNGLDYFENFVYISMRSQNELQIYTESN